ncbi:hypothetical protein D0962_19540 [Leptolyngbyaceae cyanobacterium CCMR0082]|uniref:Uncharacterized protein n=2 Tax=Adonisia turfae TaxID=2950184 RepID=A0A6M0SA50_9CYAN|nr:hypothetical protein [Adonisia turfae]MDV3347385.1 hypothetical protein [Leptothoe sp. LEGE 181152]NEZ59859.1 hypothetical protein [Adonisia turfae CCMR0081]NEZ64953.1 hypothetical protein [Adonisia turfae CCMR0082]
MLPNTFSETVALTKQFVLAEFDKTIQNQQLYYHNRWHIKTVQRRANQIFSIVAPHWQKSNQDTQKNPDLSRIHSLLDLCVATHDMVQIFLPQSHPHITRRRASGESEKATCDKLLTYICQLNQNLALAGKFQAQFSEKDIELLQLAILGTICTYSPLEESIYQPALYDSENPPHIITRILALADISSLGMDGVTVYNREGSLIFLEENPDIIPYIQEQKIELLSAEHPELAESFRQRLLKRARWQLSFARSRLSRTIQELMFFSDDVIDALVRDAFPYLNEETLRIVEKTTPTAVSTSLQQLLKFFQLDPDLIKNQLQTPSRLES